MSGARVSDGLERRLRRACAELDGSIRAGNPCRAEAYLASDTELAANSEVALELIYTEFTARQRCGEQLRIEEWYERFPQWRDDLARLIEIHELVRSTDGESHNQATHLPDDRSFWMSNELDLAGERIGQYELLEHIGRGGMGVVYKARQAGLGRIVAIKMILAYQATPQKRTRFRKEAETVARLHHPNIVQIHEVGEQGGCSYLSMEFVDGRSVDQELARSPLPARSAAKLVETLARAMHYAHGLGIVHRDLKPANVLLTRDRVPKITDFGLAKLLTQSSDPFTRADSNELPSGQVDLTATGQILGTPSYMAPEQTTGRSEAVGPATDVYALGAILYETLCGRAPFCGETPLDTLDQVRSHDPLPPRRLQPRVPRELEIICLKCLAKEPHKRYGTAEQLAEDLRRFQAGEPIEARPVAWWERGRKWAGPSSHGGGFDCCRCRRVDRHRVAVGTCGAESSGSGAGGRCRRDEPRSSRCRCECRNGRSRGRTTRTTTGRAAAVRA
jgi:serine/threonine protein kinase